MENQTEKTIEHEMEMGLQRDPSIQMMPTLGPKICNYYPKAPRTQIIGF